MIKFTLDWLKNHMDFYENIDEKNVLESLEEMERVFNEKGMEVEDIYLINPLIYTQIQSSKKKSSMKVSICTTEISKNVSKYLYFKKEKLQVLCGGENALEDIRTIMAPIGTKVGDFTIAERKICGEISEGMFCAGSEIGIKTKIKGIMETPFAEGVFRFEDVFFKLSVPTNRWDLMNVRGIARELCSAGLGELKALAMENGEREMTLSINSNINDPVSFVSVNNIEIDGKVKILMDRIGESQKTPLKYFNDFAILDIGHPIHIYDSKNISSINIRNIKKGESFKTLKQDNLICDGVETLIEMNGEPACIGGMMGIKGFNDKTTDVIIEAGYFKPKNIGNIISESSKIFDLGIDMEQFSLGYFLSYCKGDKSKIVFTNGENEKTEIIKVDYDLVARVSGLSISMEKIETLLNKYNFEIKIERQKQNSSINDRFVILVKAPSWRSDIKQEEDVIEEILRLSELKQFTEVKSLGFINKSLEFGCPESQITNRLRAMGFVEMYNFPFVSEGKEKILNSIQSDKPFLRDSLLENLRNNCLHSLSQGSSECLIFEIGKVYPEEETKLGILVGGSQTRNFQTEKKDYDIYFLKNIINSLAHYVNFDLNNQESTEIKNLKKAIKFPGGFIGQIDSDDKLLKNVFFGEFSINIKNKESTREQFQQYHYKDLSIEVNKKYSFKDIQKILCKNKIFDSNYYIFDFFEGPNNNKYGITLKTSTIDQLEFLSNKILDLLVNLKS